MSDDTKAALTPEEWCRAESIDLVTGHTVELVIRGRGDWGDHELAKAALCLRGFFTWDDVDALMESPPDEPKLTEIADRIAALLPPREQSPVTHTTENR